MGSYISLLRKSSVSFEVYDYQWEYSLVIKKKKVEKRKKINGPRTAHLRCMHIRQEWFIQMKY